MLGRSNSANTNPNNKSALLLFKPRQVLLSEHQNTKTRMVKTTTPKTLNPQQTTTLLHSVSKYLQNNGFSKTLKRFLSEAQIQSDDWKASSLDLEDLYCEFLDKSSHAATKSDTHKEQELQMNGTTKKDGNSDYAATEETTKKKKKKKSGDSDNNAVADKSGATDKKLAESEELFVFQSKAKSKGDKKSKKKSDHKEVTEEKSKDIETDHKEEAKSKDKKKKKKKTDALGEVLDRESVEPLEDTTKIDKKSSKKRKRLASDENEHQPIEKEATEESKRRKVECLKEAKNEIQLIKDESKQENGYAEKLGDKISAQKTPRSQQNGSAEPKKASAFQRVKIDEVEFADEKLQDNSYWAKDGAEIGYGAKAQEVLGQVRGRLSQMLCVRAEKRSSERRWPSSCWKLQRTLLMCDVERLQSRTCCCWRLQLVGVMLRDERKEGESKITRRE